MSMANSAAASSAGSNNGDEDTRRRRGGGSEASSSSSSEVAKRGSNIQPAISDISDAEAGSKQDPESNRPILISSIDFQGETPELEQLARSVVSIKPNFSYTIKDISADVMRIYDTGCYKEVDPMTVDTRDGVALTFRLQANPVIRGIVIRGADELPVSHIHGVFKPQFGKVMNSVLVVGALRELSEWYESKRMPVEWYGIDVVDGILEIGAEEPRVANVDIRFLDGKTGETVEGRTKPAYIHRCLKSVKPGMALHGRITDDLADLMATAGMETASITWSPRRDVNGIWVDTTINCVERTNSGFSGGGGISAKGLSEGGLSALIANADFYRRNLFGRCQTLTARLEMVPSSSSSGNLQRPEVDVKVAHYDPWIGDAGRTSRRVFLDSDSSSLEAIHARAEPVGEDAELGGADESGPKGIFVRRVVSGVEYRRPLAACCTGTFSATYQRASTHDDLKQQCLKDAYGSPLTFSGHSHDTMANALFRFVYEGTGKDEPQLVVSAEQALPIRPDMLSFNRVLVRAQRNFHVGSTKLTVGAKGGNVIGDLPPYEAFPIGGVNSVRGYAEGGVGAGRKFIVGSAELTVPLVPNSFNGCVFFDIGSDLKSGTTVLGDPGGTRGKPGQGYGYGLGVSAMTPVGPVRLEYAFSDKGVGRMHCGLSRNF